MREEESLLCRALRYPDFRFSTVLIGHTHTRLNLLPQVGSSPHARELAYIVGASYLT